MNRLMILACCTLALAFPALSQTNGEHIILTMDGKIFRGDIRDLITPGGTVTITPDTGRPVAIYWSEIAAVRCLPSGIPDSVILASFDHKSTTDKAGNLVTAVEPPPKATRYDINGSGTWEDVVFLVDGSVLRGSLINERSDGILSFWTDGRWKEIGDRAAITHVRVERGIADSTLVHTYVSTPESWRLGEDRVLTVRAGVSIPVGELAVPPEESASPWKSGYMVGVDAGMRIVPGFRWLASASYARYARGIPKALKDADASWGEPSSVNVIQIAAGVEMRTSGPSALHVHLAAQVGAAIINAPGYELTIPESFYHLPGTIKVTDLSTTGFDLALTGGILLGRFSLDAHWNFFKPNENSNVDIQYMYSDPISLQNPGSRTSMTFGLSLGFSI